MKRGFSTLEIIMSFAIIAIVLTGAVMANFGAQYWTITSQTSNEALYKAKTALESVRSIAKTDFYKAVSVPFHSDDPACTGKSSGANGLCYYEETKVTDISTCSKYAESFVSWQIEGYPTSTVSLFTTLSNPNEAVALGGDCLLDQSAQSAESANAWKNFNTLPSVDFSGQPQGIDTFNGISYVAVSSSISLQISTEAAYGGGIATDTVGYNSVDVARDESTGLTYAYVARNDISNQLGVIDVSSSTNPKLETTVSLTGVDTSSTSPQGWRVNYYGQKLYMATKQNPGYPDLHIFDVSRPLISSELGSFNVTSTIYGIKIRSQHSTSTVCRASGGVCTFAYLATDDSSGGEVLNVTDPTSIPKPVAYFNLPGNSDCSNAPAALSLALSGNTLYVGRGYNSSCQSIPELYALDITDPYSGVPIISSSVENGDSIVGLRVLGNFLFVETSPLSDTGSGSELMDIDHDYNVDRDYAYATVNAQGQHLQVWNIADPTRPIEVSDYPLSSDSLQVIYSQN